MFFFPIGTDRQLRRTPWVNYALVAVNVAIYLYTAPGIDLITQLSLYASQAQLNGDAASAAKAIEELAEQKLYGLYLQPVNTQLHQFLTYAFLHQDLLHLIGNMIFLFVFGNAVEDRLGRFGYLGFYLSGAVLAGLAHVVFDSSPVLGASGAVAAVTGAFLVLFALTDVTIGYWVIVLFGTFEVSSVVLILFRVGQDFLFQLLNIGNVAYLAHLAGYAFGFSAAGGLLVCRVLPRENVDLFAWWQLGRRRRDARKVLRESHLWESPPKPQDPPPAGSTPELSLTQEQVMQQRARISAALLQQNLSLAADEYAKLLEDHPHQVLPQNSQLDVANQFMTDQRHTLAARAYELFLKTYRGYPQRSEVQMVLGLIYARYLDQPQRARELLNLAEPALQAEHRTFAKQVLGELKG
jgi:membrane associated rhomboid family serine protease